MRGHQFGYGLAVAGADHGLAFLDQFEETGKTGLGLIHIDLHTTSMPSEETGFP